MKETDMPCCTPTAWGKLPSTANDNIHDLKGSDFTIPVSDSSSSSSNSNQDNVKNVPVYLSDADAASEIGTNSTTNNIKKGLIIFPDVWGITNRIRSIADTFATAGYTTLVLDCYYGNTVDKTPNVIEFLKTYSYDKISNEIKSAVNYLTQHKNVDANHIASMGFCWGVWAIAKSASEGLVHWKCAVGPHPSTKIETFIFERDETAMMDKCHFPFLIMPAGDDPDHLKPESQSELVRLLEGRGGMSVVFPRMTHGWTSRGDLNVKEVKEDVEKAMQLALDFIKEHN